MLEYVSEIRHELMDEERDDRQDRRGVENTSGLDRDYEWSHG